MTSTTSSSSAGIRVRRARTSDVAAIQALVEPLVQRRILLGKDAVVFYESVQEFRVVETDDGTLIGCGALHVMWRDLGEVRTLAVADEWLHAGVGHALLSRLEDDARELGLSRLFCLTFEVGFFTKHGFVDMGDETVDPEVYAELVRSHDEGVAEFLDLARVKPNTLGNTRMLKHL
ncbi:amino-acid N-acetyltransferase [Diaminobutyricibacter sp. McL0608]|uniref:amino-acid N-acetyltransferase n=1 Tax=Leifsonia sp. McL0608 TaxID=3143537 RepID=UPI0031F3094F